MLRRQLVVSDRANFRYANAQQRQEGTIVVAAHAAIGSTSHARSDLTRT